MAKTMSDGIPTTMDGNIAMATTTALLMVTTLATSTECIIVEYTATIDMPAICLFVTRASDIGTRIDMLFQQS